MGERDSGKNDVTTIKRRIAAGLGCFIFMFLVGSCAEEVNNRGRSSIFESKEPTDSAKRSENSGDSNSLNTHIEISPAQGDLLLGVSQDFFATLVHENGDKEDITQKATWSMVGAPNIVAMLRNGVFKGIAVGETKIKATFNEYEDTVTVVVKKLKLLSINLGSETQTLVLRENMIVKAAGTFVDGTTRDVSRDVQWSVDNASILKLLRDVINPGKILADSTGNATVKAEMAGCAAEKSISVVDLPVTSIEVLPTTASLLRLSFLQMSAVAHFNDGSTRNVTNAATWTRTDGNAVTVSNVDGLKGKVIGVESGTATVSATFKDQTGQAVVTVPTATLNSINIRSTSSNMTLGGILPFTADGTYSDGNTLDITTQVSWSSSAPSAASISNAAPSSGKLTALQAGTVSVTAGLNGKTSNSLVINIANATCPTNYILVPGSSELSTNAFCVMKYEAKNDGVSTYAVSSASLSPWVNIPRGMDFTSPGSAWKACRDIGPGYDLMSNTQWQVIARDIEGIAANWSNASSSGNNALNRGNSEGQLALAADSSDSNGCFGSVLGGIPGSNCANAWHINKRTHTLSTGAVIWDFAGNVWEWVQGNDNRESNSSNGIWSMQGNNGQIATSPWSGEGTQSEWGPSCNGPTGSYNCTTNKVAPDFGGFGFGHLSYRGGAILRGGCWNCSNSAGVFAAALYSGPTESNPQSGFRCVSVVGASEPPPPPLVTATPTFTLSALTPTPTSTPSATPTSTGTSTSIPFVTSTPTPTITPTTQLVTAPACTITASPEVIVAGEVSVLQMIVVGTITGAMLNNTPSDPGNVTIMVSSVSPPISRTFFGAVTGPGGSSTCSIFVTVMPSSGTSGGTTSSGATDFMPIPPTTGGTGTTGTASGGSTVGSDLMYIPPTVDTTGSSGTSGGSTVGSDLMYIPPTVDTTGSSGGMTGVTDFMYIPPTTGSTGTTGTASGGSTVGSDFMITR